MPVGRKGRRIRQQHAGQVIEIAQRVPGKLQPQIDAAEVKRIADRAGKRDPGIAGTKIPLQGERRPFAAQRQHAADFAATGERLSVVAPFRLQAEDVIAHFLRLPFPLLAGHFTERQRLTERINHDRHVSARHFVINGNLAAIEKNIVEAERPAGRRRIFLRRPRRSQVESPVVGLLRQSDQPRVGLFKLNPRQIDRFAEQRQRGESRLNARQVDHCDLRDIRGVAKDDIFGMNVRPGDPASPAALAGLAFPDDAQIAANRERAVQLGRDFLVDRRLQAVPVKGRQHDKKQNDQYDNRSQDNSHGFSGSAHPFCTPFASRHS